MDLFSHDPVEWLLWGQIASLGAMIPTGGPT
jgi:hypothetical protein